MENALPGIYLANLEKHLRPSYESKPNLHRLVNRDVATHGKKMGLAVFNFSSINFKGI